MLAPGYKGQPAANGVSPAIWGDIPVESWKNNDGGMLFYDDFTMGPKFSATGAAVASGYGGFTTSASATIQPSTLTTDLYGCQLFAPNNTANVETYMGTGNGVGNLAKMPTSSDVGKKFAFECRIAKSNISANTGFFVGLGTPAWSVTTASLADTTGDLISTTDCIGFLCLMNGGVNVDAVYQATGQTKQTLIATAKAMTAAAFVNLGFKYDPQEAISKRLKFFVDGVEQGTYITSALIQAVTFPSSVLMALLCLVKQKTTTASTVSLDWWQFGQSRV